MESAISVFAETGFAGGTTSAIATRAGVSEAQLYYHFASKRDLLGAVLAERDRIADEAAGPMPLDPADVPKALVRIAEANATMPDVVGLYMIMFAEAATATHPGHENYRDRYRRLRLRFLEAFTLMEENGMLADRVDAVYAASSTLAVWDGLQLQWLLEPEAVDVVAHLKTHLDTITVIAPPRQVER
ncbi:MAG: helix-turn-helix domain-containing protein [Lacisediminihabitans sp.]